MKTLKVKFSQVQVCGFFGRSRQAFYKSQRSHQSRICQQEIILEAVKEIRRDQPRVGVRKLHRTLGRLGFEIGRDNLFSVLRKYGLLIKRRRNYKRTTLSNHRFRKYNNLIKDQQVTSADEVFVADLTYVKLERGHCYLSLVTDLYSRKIVGWNLSESPDLVGCEKALEMALAGVADPSKLIHHSDRGAQYCSPRYVKHLELRGARMSMTEECHVYENAVAERVNGILKEEFLRVRELRNYRHALKVTEKAIRVYNEKRLHTSLNYRTPAECYRAA